MTEMGDDDVHLAIRDAVKGVKQPWVVAEDYSSANTDVVLSGGAEADFPKARDREDHRVTHGYAVQLVGINFEPGLIWFRYREPAMVFSRAGRTSAHVSSTHIVPAAYEVKFDQTLDRDIRRLYVGQGHLDQHQERHQERALLERWLDGVNLASAYWHPPRR